MPQKPKRFNNQPMFRYACLLVSGLAAAVTAHGLTPHEAEMNRPFPAHHVFGNIYFVGTDDLAVFLITTPQGHIILNAGYEETVPLVRDSILKLGFKLEDIKIILNSQAHSDHVAGLAALQKLTGGAKIYSSEREVAVLESGGKKDPRWGNEISYTPVKVDHSLHDGEEVKLGGTTLVAHFTPGHSIGCTTWSMRAQEGGVSYDVVFVGGVTINAGVHFVGHPTYPGIADDWINSFKVMRSLKCDIFLGAHGNYYGMKEKYALMIAGKQPNPFIDPNGYQALINLSEKRFLDQFAREKAEAGGATN